MPICEADPRRLQYFEHVQCPPDVRIPIEDADALTEDYCSAWIRRHLGGYSGMANIETIGGRMIEVHLRLSALGF
jgi:hypothetical protein